MSNNKCLVVRVEADSDGGLLCSDIWVCKCPGMNYHHRDEDECPHCKDKPRKDNYAGLPEFLEYQVIDKQMPSVYLEKA